MTAIATTSHTLDGFNRLPTAEAERELGACCAVPDWTRTVAAGRPYRDVGSLVAAADAALRGLSWAAVAQALAAHPRIGERAAGTDREARWSRREQAGMAAADAPTRAALVRANQDYERRFGHIFLVDAAGRGDAELLAAARDRLGNDETVERAVVHEQLRRIALRRLRRLVS